MMIFWAAIILGSYAVFVIEAVKSWLEGDSMVRRLPVS
jgi:hypothetical protein